MKKLKILVVGLVMSALILPALNLSAAEDDCTFKFEDKYEPKARVPKGPNKGKCISAHARPVVETEESKAQPVWKEYIEIANVSHMGEFYIAKIPMHGIDKVIFQLEYFPAAVPAGHTQLRLTFKEGMPVTLTRQDPNHSYEQLTVDNLVFSVEAVGHVGYKFDIFKGLKDHFATAYRVKTLESFVNRVIVEKNRKVEQWVLKMKDSEKRKLLVNYINDSQRYGLTRMYNTLTLNCTNELIHIIDKSVNYSLVEKITKVMAKGTEFYPNIIRTALVSRGLLPLNKSTDIELLGDDPTIAQMLTDLRQSAQ